MSYIAHIRNNATGEVRTKSFDKPWDDGEDDLIIFMWEGGNYGCDCNRAIFFYDDDEEGDFDCGEGAFAVRLVRDGVEFYSDGEWVLPFVEGC